MATDPENYFSNHAREYAETYAMEDMPVAYVALLDEFVERVGSGTVLDAGCGTGRDATYFSRNGLDVTGVDVAEGMIDHARQHAEGTFRRMDMRDLDFADGTFDGVWCNTVMQFFDPGMMPSILSELSRVLTPDGTLYVTFKIGEGTVTREDFGEVVERHLVPEADAKRMVRARNMVIVEEARAELNGLTVLNLFAESQQDTTV